MKYSIHKSHWSEYSPNKTHFCFSMSETRFLVSQVMTNKIAIQLYEMQHSQEPMVSLFAEWNQFRFRDGRNQIPTIPSYEQ